MNRVLVLVIGINMLIAALFTGACANQEVVVEKASTLLLRQIELRKDQLAKPTTERLALMTTMGMNVDDIGVQRVFMYLAHELTLSQLEELEAMDIMLYPESWIPPVGSHSTGFITADMTIGSLKELAAKDYVVRMDTAERLIEPGNTAQPESK